MLEYLETIQILFIMIFLLLFSILGSIFIYKLKKFKIRTITNIERWTILGIGIAAIIILIIL